jgi:FkbM family methyltransferase
LDLGANNGEYSLIAAKLGHDVLLVEPFYSNILKIHKAAQLENIHDRMTLIKNKISNKRSLLESESSKIKNSGLVLDDLINFLPKNRFNQSYKNAIVKIDMNQIDMKPIIFESAGSLFKKVNINFMIMKNLKKNAINDKLLTYQIQKMISFLSANNLTAYDLNGDYLDKEKWMYWPNNVAWEKTYNLTRLNF